MNNTLADAPAALATTTVSDTPPQPDAVEIAELRKRIDTLDSQLVALWQERAAVSSKIGQARVASGGTRLSLAREQQVIARFQTTLGPIGARLALLILEAGRGSL